MVAAMSKIDKALKQLKREMGADLFPVVKNEFWPTGWYGLDRLLGGGFKLGSMNEIIGYPETCKTTFGLQMAAKFLETNKSSSVCLVDAEKSYDPAWAEKLGCPLDHKRVIYCRPNSLEQGFYTIFKLVKTGEVRFLILDSWHAFRPSKEIEDDKIVNDVALQPRLLGQCVMQLINELTQAKAIGIALNHMTRDFGRFGGINSPGGRHLKHYSTHRLAFYRKKADFSQDENACRVSMRLLRSKVHSTQRGAVEYDLMPGVGIIPQAEALDIGKEKGLITQGGAWYTINIPKLAKDLKFQGREAMIAYLLEHPKVIDAIYRK